MLGKRVGGGLTLREGLTKGRWGEPLQAEETGQRAGYE
jgi:hypothetical protein